MKDNWKNWKKAESYGEVLRDGALLEIEKQVNNYIIEP